VSWAATKIQARLDVHNAFALPVLYYLAGTTTALALASPLTARLHNKVVLPPSPETGGYAQMLEGVTKVLFNRQQLNALGVVPAQGDYLQFTDYPLYAGGFVTATLDVRDPRNGPVVDKWSVSLS
jgi:hypothetical protein